MYIDHTIDTLWYKRSLDRWYNSMWTCRRDLFRNCVEFCAAVSAFVCVFWRWAPIKWECVIICFRIDTTSLSLDYNRWSDKHQYWHKMYHDDCTDDRWWCWDLWYHHYQTVQTNLTSVTLRGRLMPLLSLPAQIWRCMFFCWSLLNRMVASSFVHRPSPECCWFFVVDFWCCCSNYL